MRRHGHVTEQFPGNIASALHGAARQASPGAYLAMEDQSESDPGLVAFLDNPQSEQSASSWDTLLPTHLQQPDPYATWTSC